MIKSEILITKGMVRPVSLEMEGDGALEGIH